MGNHLSAKKIFQNEIIDNLTSANFEPYIKRSSVYSKTSENILINIDKNIDKKKFKAKSNPKYQETNILIHELNSRSVRDFKHENL